LHPVSAVGRRNLMRRARAAAFVACIAIILKPAVTCAVNISVPYKGVILSDPERSERGVEGLAFSGISGSPFRWFSGGDKARVLLAVLDHFNDSTAGSRIIATSQMVSVAAAEASSEVSVAAYRQHLQALDYLVAACQKQRSSCDPKRVGEDERVQWTVGVATQSRQIRYGWLRLLLEQAAKTNEKTSDSAAKLPPKSGQTAKATNPPLAMDALLKQARERLAEDWKQAGGSGQTATSRSAEHNKLNAILARREFLGVKKLNPKEQLMEKLTNWLNEFLARLAGYASRFPWLSGALRGLLLVAILLGLGWALLQIERRSRIRIVPNLLSSSASPSAREWQLWLQDAHEMSEMEQWREAIHFVYWASISRLESLQLWPVDRARTPREYLDLVSAEDPRKTSLHALTRSFERTWYGGRAADSDAYQAALGLAAELGVE